MPYFPRMLCGLLPIKWQNEKNWAPLCTFRGSKLMANHSIDTLRCINQCNKNPMCSHFSWELDEDTQEPKCHLFTGSILKNMSFYSHNQNSICGLKDKGGIDSEGLPQIGKSYNLKIHNNNIRTKYHSIVGKCQYKLLEIIG